MKKYILILAMGVSLTLVACGNESTTTETNDSNGTVTDTTAVSVDTTAQTPEVKVEETK